MFVVPEKIVLILNEITMYRKLFPRVLGYITL